MDCATENPSNLRCLLHRDFAVADKVVCRVLIIATKAGTLIRRRARRYCAAIPDGSGLPRVSITSFGAWAYRNADGPWTEMEC
jgi:hypothetical protein